MLSQKEFLSIAWKQEGNYFDNSENHIRETKKTSDYLLRNGTSEYIILLPSEYTEREKMAADELQELFKEASDCTLPIATDNAFSYEKRYISIGNTILAKQAEINIQNEIFALQGYRICSFKNSVLLLGRSDFGSLYAVYDFLNVLLAYDYLNPGTYKLKKGVRDIPLLCFDVKEIPDIEAFSRNYGTFSKIATKNVLSRYRMTEREDTVMTLDGSASVHNMMMFVPFKTFGEAHPLWFSDHENLCLTAHGDKEEYDALVDVVVQKIQKEFINGAKGNVMFFGQSDGSPVCDCPTCKANKEKYGADTGSCVLFLNDVLDKVYAWFETVDGHAYKRDFYIAILAYLAFEFAPASYNEKNGKFTMNGGLRVHDKLGFISAPIKYDYGSLSTAEKNIPYYRNILAWGATTNKSMFYTYDFNTRYYFCPNETLVSKQELYRLMAGLKCIFLYDQGQWTNEGLPTGFAMLKIYVSSKLRWNVNENVDALIEKYFKDVYGLAGDTMLGLYLDFRRYWANRREREKKGEFNPRYLNYSGCLLGEHELWDFHKLLEWKAGYEKAMKEIEPMKQNDKQAYELTYRNIIAERVSITYLLLLNYSNRFSCEKLNDMRLQFKADTELIALEKLKEGAETWDGRHSMVSEVFADWEII